MTTKTATTKPVAKAATSKRAPRKATAVKAAAPKAAVKRAAAVEPVAIKVVDAKTAAERTSAAVKERRALRIWEQAGRKGRRPATPNLAAVNEDKLAGGRMGARPKAAKAGGQDFTGTSVAGRQRMTEADIVAWITKALAAAAKAGEEPTKNGLLRQFQAAGFAANPKRFERCREAAVKAAGSRKRS